MVNMIYEVALRFLSVEAAEEAQIKIHERTGFVTEKIREIEV